MRTTIRVVMAAGVLALGTAGPVWSQCVQGPGVDQAKYSLLIDGTTSCAKLSQAGCRISGGQGTCEVPGLFRAQSTLASDGSVSWSLLSHTVGIDAVLVGGASSGNACANFYPDDADTGQSGLGFRKSTGQYSNVTYVEFCTDGEDSIDPTAAVPVPACPEDVQTALDEVFLATTDIAITYQFDDNLGVVSSLCVKGGLENPNVTVIPCLNEPVPIPGPTALPRCSEVVSPETGLPFVLKNNSTYFMAGVQRSSCVYTCVPPPMTLGGRSQCAYVCR